MMIISMSTSGTPTVPVQVLQAGPPVRRVPFALARRFSQICTTASAEAIEPVDLTPLEFAVMAHVNPADGEPDLDQNGLAARLGVDRNSVSLFVASLERKGLVARRASDTDRRTRLVRLTSKGERLFDRLNPRAIERQESVLEALDPSERELLMDLLVRVIEANASRARPGSGRRKRTPNGQTDTKT